MCRNTNKRFKKYEGSGVSGQRVDMVLYFNETESDHGTSVGYLNKYIDSNTVFQKQVFDLCGLPPTVPKEMKSFLAGALVPLAAAFGKYVFDMAIAKQINDLKELKASAVKPYNSTALVSVENLKKLRCGVVARYKDVEEGKPLPEPGLIAIFKVQDAKDKLERAKLVDDLEGKAFVLEPVYVNARNAVAVTNDPGTEKKPKINVTIGIAVKAVALMKLVIRKSLKSGKA